MAIPPEVPSTIDRLDRLTGNPKTEADSRCFSEPRYLRELFRFYAHSDLNGRWINSPSLYLPTEDSPNRYIGKVEPP
jgi:hypothetical protein